MNLCPDCGNPLGDDALTNCGKTRGEECDRDRGKFFGRVEETKRALTLPALAAMSESKLPPIFDLGRVGAVALAQLLMEALRQNDELYKRIPKQ